MSATTAVVLSGGGSLGAVQVGMLQALVEHGVSPDLIVGTSVGAINAAWLAGRSDLEGVHALAEVWRSVHRDDVFPARPLTGLMGFFGRSDHLVSAEPLRKLLKAHLAYDRLEDAPVRVTVVAADVLTGQEVALTHGDAVDAVTASAAIPGVFAPVLIDGRELMDGGVVNNTPISIAVAEGAETIWVLPTGSMCDVRGAPRSAFGMGMQAITLMIQQRLVADIARWQDTVDLRIAPTLCPMRVSPIDFGHTSELISRAHESTERWLSDAAAHRWSVPELVHAH